MRVRSPLPALTTLFDGAASYLSKKVFLSVRGHWYLKSKTERIQFFYSTYNPEFLFYNIFIGQSNIHLRIDHGCGDENCFNPTHLIEVEYPVLVTQEDT